MKGKNNLLSNYFIIKITKKEGDIMTFDFVVKRYYIGSQKSKVLGGFLDLESAKYFTDRIDGDYINPGFFYIDTPQGKYIYGEKTGYREVGGKWYEPGQKAYVYSSIEDRVMHIDEVVSYDF